MRPTDAATDQAQVRTKVYFTVYFTYIPLLFHVLLLLSSCVSAISAAPEALFSGSCVPAFILPPNPKPPPSPPVFFLNNFKPSKSFFFRVRTPPPKLFSRSRLPFMKGSNVEVQHTRTYNYTHNNYTHNNCTHNNYTHNNYAHNTTHITI